MSGFIDLTGRTVLITGASSGIGRACARSAASLGARLVLTGRREESLIDTLTSVDDPNRHVVELFDLRSIDELPAWIGNLVKRHGFQLDGLVHCAGVNKLRPIRNIKRDNIDDIMLPNLYAAIMLVRACSARGVASETGASYVLLSSIAAFSGQAGMSVYAASKGGLISFARSAAQELAPRRIRVNCIAAGYVNTPMVEEQRRSTTVEAFAANLSRQALGLIEPEEVAAMVAFLLSDAASHISGSTFTVDGAYQ